MRLFREVLIFACIVALAMGNCVVVKLTTRVTNSDIGHMIVYENNIPVCSMEWTITPDRGQMNYNRKRSLLCNYRGYSGNLYYFVDGMKWSMDFRSPQGEWMNNILIPYEGKYENDGFWPNYNGPIYKYFGWYFNTCNRQDVLYLRDFEEGGQTNYGGNGDSGSAASFDDNDDSGGAINYDGTDTGHTNGDDSYDKNSGSTSNGNSDNDDNDDDDDDDDSDDDKQLTTKERTVKSISMEKTSSSVESTSSSSSSSASTTSSSSSSTTSTSSSSSSSTSAASTPAQSTASLPSATSVSSNGDSGSAAPGGSNDASGLAPAAHMLVGLVALFAALA